MEKKSCNVTPAVNNYRECVRSLWNNFYRPLFEESRDYRFVDSFRIVREELFNGLVLTNGVDSEGGALIPARLSGGLKVLLADGQAIPILANRDIDQNYGYWDHPVSSLKSPIDLDFLSFFDWDDLGFLDMSIVMARVFAYDANPEMINRVVLIDVQYVEKFILKF